MVRLVDDHEAQATAGRKAQSVMIEELGSREHDVDRSVGKRSEELIASSR